MTTTLFFIASKLFHFILIPGSWMAMLTVIAWSAIAHGRTRLAKGALIGVLGVYFVVSFTPISNALLRALETRYPIPVVNWANIDGIIVLGGAISTDASSPHAIAIGEAGERLTVPLWLLKQHPHLRVLHTGFSGNLMGTRQSESDLAKQFWIDQGIAPHRILIENKSRNTLENARYTRAQLGPNGSRWILVTSACHMPRSIDTFQQLGIRPIPYPVDYTTSPTITWTFDFGLGQIYISKWLHEVIGLWVYRIVTTFHIIHQ